MEVRQFDILVSEHSLRNLSSGHLLINCILIDHKERNEVHAAEFQNDIRFEGKDDIATAKDDDTCGYMLVRASM